MKLDSYAKWKSSAVSLAEDLLEAKKAEEAERLLQKVLLVEAGERDVRFLYFSTLEQLNRNEGMRAEGLFLSLLSGREGKPKEAFEILLRMLERFPEDVNLQLKLAKLATETGEEEKAESLYSSLGRYYIDKGLPYKAVDAYRQIIRFNPDKFEYYRKMADIFLSLGMVKEGIDQYFELVHRYLEKQMKEDAATLLEMILDRDAANSPAAWELARIYVEKNKINDASKVLRKQIDVQLELGRSDEANRLTVEFSRILQERNQSAQAISEEEFLAKQLFARGKKEDAVVLFHKIADQSLAIGQTEKFFEFMQQFVRFHLMKGDMQKVGDGYKKIILAAASDDRERVKGFTEELIREFLQRERIRELDQNLREIASAFESQGNKQESERLLVRLAEIYVSIYKLQDAIAVYKSIVESDGQDPKTYLALAELYLKEEKLSLAVDAYMDAVKLYAKKGQTDRAEEILQFALDKEPKNLSLLARMGDIYYGIGDWDRALDYYQRGLQIDPSHRKAVVGMAMTYAKKGMLNEMVALAKRLVTKGVIAEIIEEYKKALAVNMKEAESCMALGLLYKDLGFLEEAIIELQKASKDPKYLLKAHDLLGQCFKMQGFEDLAIRQYRKALEQPGYPEEELIGIRYNLAVTYEEVKMFREAQELYRDILVSDIGYKDVANRIKNLGQTGSTGKVVSLPSDWGDRR